MKLVLSPAFSLHPFSLPPSLLPGPLTLVLLDHSTFVLTVLSACTLFPRYASVWPTPSASSSLSPNLTSSSFFFNIYIYIYIYFTEVSPGGSDRKESVCNAGDLGFIPGLGRSPGEGNGNPLYYSCLENSMERGAWQAESDTTERLAHTNSWFTKLCQSLQYSQVIQSHTYRHSFFILFPIMVYHRILNIVLWAIQ